jgi:phthiocerol/phenolphthiocerol synthesis type-I polyketide synthase D
MQFGLIFFSSREATGDADKYHLLIESAKFADRHDFSSVWIPERHFTKDGWLYPNPVVLQAALARETERIALRAGSVVMPLHDPIRVAEEWAVVDNLSNGRVGISFASGWHPNDFVFFPEKYAHRHEEMYQCIQTVQKLWQGESIWRKGGDGKDVEIKIYPTPIQPKLPIWVTAAGNPNTFARAGAVGANLLTHMYNQSIEELAEKIALYRKSRADHGYDPQAGQVTVMLHTFIGENANAVLEQAQPSFCDYLKSASYLLNAIAYSRDQKIDLSVLSEQDLNDYLSFVFDRLISTHRVLFGTPETCFELVRQLKTAGVDEIACQMDFGLDVDRILKSLPFLNQLKERCNAEIPVAPSLLSASSYRDGISRGDGFSNAQASGSGNYREPGRPQGSPLPYTVGPVGPRFLVEPASPQENSDLHLSPVQEKNPLQDIQARCREEIAVHTFYNKLSQRGIQLGARFQGIERLWRGDREALGQVRILKALEQGADSYQVHPAFLDACFQVLVAALPTATLLKNEESLYLPVGLRSFEVHNRPGTSAWSHAVLKPNADEAEDIFEGDIHILDEEGRLLIHARGLQLQRTGTTAQPGFQEDLKNLLYELHWEQASLEKYASAEGAGNWLIFMDRGGVGQRIGELLTERGESCIGVFSGENYSSSPQGDFWINPTHPEHMQQLMKEVLGPGASLCRGVIHLWSLDATPTEETSIASLEADQALGIGSALSIIQALVGIEATEFPRLWFVTRGAQSVGVERAPLAVAQSPLWGLGRTCAVEHPELWGGLIDIDPQGTIDETAGQLLDALSIRDKEDQIAFRQGQAYVARVVRSGNWARKNLELRSDASYLITGGLWGLGFEVARWLVKNGARHLVLLGRTRLPQREEWSQVPSDTRLARQISGIHELEESGVHLHYAAVDVADEGQLTALLDNLHHQDYPPIRGVIHAASVWQDQQGQSLVRPLARLNSAALQEVIRPKMLGGWLVQKLLKDTALDFFVCFSSAASLFGSAGQGNYAAASAFLDALAHHLRASGKPALSIDWGAVSETGFGATPEGLKVHEYWESHGIYRISPGQVLAALEQLIPQNICQIGVIKLDWHLLQQFYPQMADLPLVTSLADRAGSDNTRAATTAGEEGTLIQTLLHVASEERRQLLETYFREQVASILRLPAAKLDVRLPLTTLGLDSLMAIELKNRVELELGIRIPIVTFLQGPSIVEFTSQVLNQLAEVFSTVSTQAGAAVPDQSRQETNAIPLVGQTNAEQLLAELNHLSDEEVDSLLSRMLQEENAHIGLMDGISRQDSEHMLGELDQLPEQEVAPLLSNILQKESEQ